jgi:hypothetical protein
MYPVLRPWFAAGVVCALASPATPALDLTLGAGPVHNCPASANAISFNAAAISYVEPGPVLSIEDYGGGHFAASRGNNLGIGIAYGELTGEVAGFCIGALYRDDYRAVASQDLLDVLVNNHFGNTFTPGRTYHLSLADNSFKATGLRLRRTTDFQMGDQWSAKLGVAASALKGLAGQQESASGSVTATSPNYAVGTGIWSKADADLNLAHFNPFVAPGTPEGYGFSTDFEFLAESKGGSSIDFTVIDALGRLYWRDVPQTFRSLNNATLSYNADFNRNAFVVGYDSRVSFVQDLATKYRLAYTVPVVSRLSAVVADDRIENYNFPSVGARYGSLQRFGEIDYDFRTKSVSIGAASPTISAMLTSSSPRLGRASVLGLSIQAIHAW